MDAPSVRTLVIVGGVASGASAATRARRMNEHARIILLEKDEHVSFANCGLPYYLGGEIEERSRLLVATPELFSQRFNIDVRTRHEVTAIDRARRVVQGRDRASGGTFEVAYDRLILATGASPVVPPLAGVDAPNVFVLRNLADTDKLKEYLDARAPRRAVVVGAGFIGLEMVEQLTRRGLSTALVELLPQVLPPLDREMAHLVQEELERHGVALHLGDALESLELDGGRVMRVRLRSGASLEADLVVLGLGVRPNTALAEQAGLALGPSRGIQVNAHLQTSDPLIYAAGDAVEYTHGVLGEPVRMPLAGPANRAGRLAGEHAATDGGPALAPVLGTSIVRVFGVTAATTGLSSKQAAKLGREATAVFIEARHHAGYYPGAQPMVLKLVYAPDSGRVLGAQVVGGEGVDKRVDVLATLIQLGGTVEDLTELDLAYAPPFGSARDPLHQAGFVASNLRAGTLRAVGPEAAVDGKQVVDVRTASEWAQGHLPGAHHIPVDALRGRFHELDPKRPTVVVCRTGLRAYTAARLLQQQGFADVSVLTGGMLIWRHSQQGRPPAVEGRVGGDPLVRAVTF